MFFLFNHDLSRRIFERKVKKSWNVSMEWNKKKEKRNRIGRGRLKKLSIFFSTKNRILELYTIWNIYICVYLLRVTALFSRDRSQFFDSSIREVYEFPLIHVASLKRRDTRSSCYFATANWIPFSPNWWIFIGNLLRCKNRAVFD